LIRDNIVNHRKTKRTLSRIGAVYQVVITRRFDKPDPFLLLFSQHFYKLYTMLHILIHNKYRQVEVNAILMEMNILLLR